MWRRWIPWRYLLRKVAMAQGFIDPIKFLSQIQRFAQPSEIVAPIELLRLSTVLQARGIMNAQAIQHNLDWVWPYWVNNQFNPRDPAFVPRAFSITHINLTHRNWTAVGLPDLSDYPIVDPRGLLTPHYDGWSLDAWLLEPGGVTLTPSREQAAEQGMRLEGNLAVWTRSASAQEWIRSQAEMLEEDGQRVCRLEVEGFASREAWLVVSVRPFNPEGVSFIDHLKLLEDRSGWKIDDKHFVYFHEKPDRHRFSEYHQGDVFRSLPEDDVREEIKCRVGMATAAALWKIQPGKMKRCQLTIPLGKKNTGPVRRPADREGVRWETNLKPAARLRIPDAQYQFLYDAALRSMLLHSPDDVYPGPYTYRHFWFRDAAFILHALLCAGLKERATKILKTFPKRQRPTGYFCSQDGEWDSNGQVLWIVGKYQKLIGGKLTPEWEKTLIRAVHWIRRKRLGDGKEPHAGLLPPGFSAEHLGPNDYYYWDDFWSIAGLDQASELLHSYGNDKEAAVCREEAEAFRKAIDKSFVYVDQNIGDSMMPASPYRRMDTGAIGSLSSDYPGRVWPAGHPRVMRTIDYLLKNSFVGGGFFHDMSHSGINPYLTLHIAQVLLRAGDVRFFKVVKDLADLATPTGQWPEAVHPQTRGGCMGDGQHIWAAAEWVMMIRNFLVREEGGALILGSGVAPAWLRQREEIYFGPAPTEFGDITLSIRPESAKAVVHITGNWRGPRPLLEVRFPGFEAVSIPDGKDEIEIPTV